jgi:AcrR family transcriptional regulator
VKRGRGHSVGLTREKVLDAAMALVDQHGLSALSMRKLGAELGVEAMTVYNHVPSKDALLDGLVERLLHAASDPLFTDSSWQAALRGFAESWRSTLQAHPHLLPVVLSRPAVTAGNLQLMESVLQRLQQAGFPLCRGLDIMYAVAGFVVGNAATEAGDPHAGDRTGVLADTDLRAHPLLAEAVGVSRSDPVDHFEFALEAMLRGFAAHEDLP